MIHFAGVHTFPLPLAEVAAKLSDAGFLANCVPDAQVSEATPDKAVGKTVSYQLVTKTIGASSTVNTRLEFKEADGGKTDVHWTGDLVALTGLLKMVPHGLIEGSAKKVIDEIWAALEKKLVAS